MYVKLNHRWEKCHVNWKNNWRKRENLGGLHPYGKVRIIVPREA